MKDVYIAIFFLIKRQMYSSFHPTVLVKLANFTKNIPIRETNPKITTLPELQLPTSSSETV